MSLTPDTVVLFHRGCNDGIASAWAAHEVLGDNALYAPYQYNEPLPEMCIGRHVFLVDLSFSLEQCHDAMAHGVLSIMIIDHHKSAVKALEPSIRRLENYTEYLHVRDSGVQFNVWLFADVKHSGAVLTWAFFNNKLAEDSEHWDKQVPLILQYIEDYDLWRRKLDNTMAINSWLINGDLSIERFSTMVRADGTPRLNIIETGNALIHYDAKVQRHVLREYVQYIQYKGRKIPIINAPHHLRNNIGDAMSMKHPFVVLYTERDGKTIYSLRANKKNASREDVSLIAEQHKGGGHEEAAAFAIPHSPLDMYKHQALFEKPSLWQRLKMAWCIIKG